jgi:hypothetical protein
MNLFKFKSIRTRLTILFLLIALSPLAIVLTITYFQRADTIESRTIVKLTAIRDLKVQQLNNWLDERVGDMHVMAGDHEISDNENIFGKKEKSVEDINKTETARDLINRNLRNYDDYEEILIIDSNTGLVELSTNPEFIGENKSRNSYFSVPLETGEVYIKDIYYSNTTKRAEMVFSIPILCLEHNTHIIGIFAARINLDASLYKLLQNRVGLGNTGETLIVNKNGIALSELRWHDNAPLNLKIEAEPAVNAASGMTGIAITNDYRGERVLAAYTFIPQTNWGFVCKQDMKELNSPIVEMIWNFIIMFILTSLGTFIIARIFSISISKPISSRFY